VIVGGDDPIKRALKNPAKTSLAVAQHGGSIEIDETPGGGATFNNSRQCRRLAGPDLRHLYANRESRPMKAMRAGIASRIAKSLASSSPGKRPAFLLAYGIRSAGIKVTTELAADLPMFSRVGSVSARVTSRRTRSSGSSSVTMDPASSQTCARGS